MEKKILDGVTMEGYDFDVIEASLSNPHSVVGFGNPHSRLTALEQFQVWKKMILSGEFVDRDDFCNRMATY